jgi:hypothetical protein
VICLKTQKQVPSINDKADTQQSKNDRTDTQQSENDKTDAKRQKIIRSLFSPQNPPPKTSLFSDDLKSKSFNQSNSANIKNKLASPSVSIKNKLVSPFWYIILLIGGFSIQSFAQFETTRCVDFMARIAQIDYRRQNFTDMCYLSTNPNTYSTMKYRTFSFTQEGSMIVFNSFGPSDTMTGARHYFFFPKNQFPSIKQNKETVSLYTGAKGVEFTIDQKKSRIVELKGGVFTEDPEIGPNNNGGFDITKTPTLMLDCGYQTGKDPCADPKRKSVFKDIDSVTCEVMNNEVFNYSASGNPSLKHTNAELIKFLALRCPAINQKSIL